MNKKNLILSAILVVLIISSYIYQGPFKKWQENNSKPNNFLSNISLDNIKEIEINNKDEKIVLKREEKKWKIEGTKDFYVKDSIADSLDFVLENINKGELEIVSKNKDKKQSFETDGEVSVKITQNNQDIEFALGKNTSDFDGSYISQNNNDKTYKVKVNLGVFKQKEWRDSQIFSFMKERVGKVRFQYPRKQFLAEKKNNKWVGTAPYKFPISEEKIDKILETMSKLKAVKIPEQKFEGTGLEKNLIIVQATGEGVDETIMIGDWQKQEDGDPLFFVKRGDSDNIYLITKEDRDVFKTTERGLR